MVADRPPACLSGLCKRWQVRESPAAGMPSRIYDDRFRVDPRTTVARRVLWLNGMTEEGARLDRRELGWISARALEVGGDSPFAIAQALLDLQNLLIGYAHDDDGEEIFQTARFSFRVGRGDCEDKAVSFATTAVIAGLEADVAWLDQPRANNNHVAARVCLAHLGGRRIAGPVPEARLDGINGAWRSVRITGRAWSPDCVPAWVEATLRGARPNEHPYDALARLGSQSADRKTL